MDPRPADVIPRAIIREAIPATAAAGTPDAIARAMHENVDRGNWRAGLEVSGRKPVDGRKIAEKGEQIGIERDDITGKKDRTKDPDEEKRYTDYNKASELVKKYLESSLTAPEKKTIKKAIEKKLRQSPAFAREIDGLPNPAAKEALLDRYMADPAFAGAVREALDEHIGPEAKMIDEEEINKAFDKVDEKAIERGIKEEEFKDARDRLQNIDEQLKEFKRGEDQGKSADEIDRLEAALPELRAELGDLGKTIDELEYQLPRLDRELDRRRGPEDRTTEQINNEIEEKRTLLTNAKNKKIEIEGTGAKLEALKQQEKELQVNRREISKEKLDRELEFKKLDLEYTQKRRDLEDLKAGRESQEKSLVEGMQNVFSEATGKLIEEQLTAATTAFEAEAARLKAEAGDPAQRAMFDALRDRWLLPPRVGRGFLWVGRRNQHRPIDRLQVNEDTNTLISEGPEALAINLLQSRVNEATGINYTLPEAQALVRNPDFANTTQNEMIKQVLARRLLVGKMSPEDIHAVVNSPWGSGMIEAGFAQNTQFRDAAKRVLGANSLEGHGFLSRVKDEFIGNPALFALLLGIPAVVGALRTGAHDVARH